MLFRISVLMAVCASLLAAPALAYEYTGRLNLGAYAARENVKTSDSGSSANDAMLSLARAYLDVTRIGGDNLEVIVDARDKYDAFGRVDPALGRLVQANETQVRQLVLKSPPSSGTVYWSVCRFVAADASVLGNDGLEGGYRWNSTSRVAFFGGLYPEHRGNRSMKLPDEDRQIGAYGVYEDLGRTGDSHVYAATSLVMRRAVSDVESLDNPAAPLSGSTLPGQSPSLPPDHPIGNYLFWYANAIKQFENGQRLSYLSHIDVQPSLRVRNLWASLYEPISPQFIGTLGLIHLNLTEYQRRRDLLDRLPPSAYTQVGGDVRWKFSTQIALVGETSYGMRVNDSKNQALFGGKIVATGLMRGHLTLFGGGGYRKNFISNDLFTKAGATYYATSTAISANVQYTNQNRDSGVKLHPLVVDFEASSMFSRQIMGSVVLESARDEQASVFSVLLSLGYRINHRQLTPMRDAAPRLERLL